MREIFTSMGSYVGRHPKIRKGVALSAAFLAFGCATPSRQEHGATHPGVATSVSANPNLPAGPASPSPTETSSASTGGQGGGGSLAEHTDDLTCLGVRIARPALNVLRLTPIVQSNHGNLRSSDYTTVVDVFDIATTNPDGSRPHQTPIPVPGLGKTIEVAVNGADPQFDNREVIVSIQYYASGPRPQTPDDWSLASAKFTNRIGFACPAIGSPLAPLPDVGGNNSGMFPG